MFTRPPTAYLGGARSWAGEDSQRWTAPGQRPPEGTSTVHYFYTRRAGSQDRGIIHSFVCCAVSVFCAPSTGSICAVQEHVKTDDSFFGGTKPYLYTRRSTMAAATFCLHTPRCVRRLPFARTCRSSWTPTPPPSRALSYVGAAVPRSASRGAAACRGMSATMRSLT